MSVAEFDRRHGDIAAIAVRIDHHVRDFHEAGEFSQTREAVLDRMGDSLRAWQKRVEEAVRGGSVWRLIRIQASRDYALIFDSFAESLEHLDAEVMKRKSDARPAHR